MLNMRLFHVMHYLLKFKQHNIVKTIICDPSMTKCNLIVSICMGKSIRIQKANSLKYSINVHATNSIILVLLLFKI